MTRDRGIKHFRPICPVVALDKGVLSRLLGLYRAELNATLRTPLHNALGAKFWAIVQPKRLGLPAAGHHLLHTRITLGRQ